MYKKIKNLDCLTEHENMLRKYWLSFYLLSVFIGLASILIKSVLCEEPFSRIAFYLIIQPLFSYLIFRSAFQKHGTLILKILLALGLGFPLAFATLLKTGELKNDMTLYGLGFSVVSLWFHYQLLKINTKIRKEKVV